MKILYTLFFLFFTLCILTNSQLSLAYALLGLQLWFEKMIPALLPFMILSGVMVRMHLTENFSKVLYPIIKPLFRVSENVCYAMIMGFLCGFPMGAKTVSDLLKRNMISDREAEFLLAFCNNIGPVYFCSFALPLLGLDLVLPYVIGMYGLPFLYGLALRHTGYRDLKAQNFPSNIPVQKGRLLWEIDDAISSSIQSILSLGGYMILFNLINLIPHILCGGPPIFLAPMFEITGGLKLVGSRLPLYALLILPFGGLSCIAQTYSCIRGTGLSISKYTLHKIMLTLLTCIYYFGWYLLAPGCFLN